MTIEKAYYRAEVIEIEYGIAGKADMIFLLSCYQEGEDEASGFTHVPDSAKTETGFVYITLPEKGERVESPYIADLVMDEMGRERKVKSNTPFMIIPPDGKAYISGWKAMFSLMSALDRLKEFQEILDAQCEEEPYADAENIIEKA